MLLLLALLTRLATQSLSTPTQVSAPHIFQVTFKLYLRDLKYCFPPLFSFLSALGTVLLGQR